MKLAPEAASFASFATDYDRVIELKVIVRNVPRVGKGIPDLSVWTGGTLRSEKLRGKSEGETTTYTGKVMTTEMPADLGGALFNGTKKISLGLKLLISR